MSIPNMTGHGDVRLSINTMRRHFERDSSPLAIVSHRTLSHSSWRRAVGYRRLDTWIGTGVSTSSTLVTRFRSRYGAGGTVPDVNMRLNSHRFKGELVSPPCRIHTPSSTLEMLFKGCGLCPWTVVRLCRHHMPHCLIFSKALAFRHVFIARTCHLGLPPCCPGQRPAGRDAAVRDAPVHDLAAVLGCRQLQDRPGLRDRRCQLALGPRQGRLHQLWVQSSSRKLHSKLGYGSSKESRD